MTKPEIKELTDTIERVIFEWNDPDITDFSDSLQVYRDHRHVASIGRDDFHDNVRILIADAVRKSRKAAEKRRRRAKA